MDLVEQAVRACGDCGVGSGWPHRDGCDVARCTECGWQRISCEHEDEPCGWGQIWTGEWPGDAEVREFGLRDLNDLASRARQGLLVWEPGRQRWTRP